MRDVGDYGDWDESWQDAWDSIPGVNHFREFERDEAMGLFEVGFMHHQNERGYDADLAEAARDQFFEFTGLPPELFPWDEWREAMGYSDE